MATQMDFMRISITAKVNLQDKTSGTGSVYKGIALAAGDFCAAGSDCDGILQYGGASGDNITIGYFGHMKFTAGQAITPGTRVTMNASGYCNPASHTDLVVGRNAELAVGSGAVGRGLFNFITPPPFEAQSAGNADFLNFTTVNSNMDEDAALYKAIDFTTADFAPKGSGGIATAGTANGILYATAASGQIAAIRYQGEVLLRAGDVITAGRNITATTSAWFIDADSGDAFVGVALEASGAPNSGGTFKAFVDMSTIQIAVDCNYMNY